MKRTGFVILILFLGAALFGEVTAVVKDVSGKVEIKVSGGTWKRAYSGMKISKGDYISTGFKSEAVLVLGNSQVVVKQLTRMELEELVEKEGTVHTGLNLRVGRVRAEVKTAKGLKQQFTLKSPISTAAVRGTSFEYDGRNLTVFEGTVAFTNPLGQGRLVPAGGASRMAPGGGLPKSPEEVRTLLTSVDPSTIPLLAGAGASEILDFLNSLTNVTIVLNWGGESVTTNPEQFLE